MKKYIILGLLALSALVPAVSFAYVPGCPPMALYNFLTGEPCITTAPSTSVPTASKVLGAHTYNFTLQLKFGDTNTEVTELQKYLQSHGYSAGPVDGIFGPTLKRAVVDFQTSMNLWADGIVGSSTRAILNQ
ncbi:MAG: peptidoglycan-binding domain-containing protein [Patescibacteria group bacterium]